HAVRLLETGLLPVGLTSRLQPYTETIDLGPSPEARRNPYLAAELFLRKQGVTVRHTRSSRHRERDTDMQ
ncbi:hypothetical protein, partial [Klebsiella pneumoniae]|uniref:hypothetical protein n=1 Tax=Klebsiella pneumoniae TaxID=573 RepID=UPI00396A53E1